MARFVKKPVIIDAEQWDGTYDGIQRICAQFPEIQTKLLHPYNAEELIVANGQKWGWVIGALEGSHEVSIGDWVIKGVKGEFYPCKPDVFALTYEAVEE